MSRSLLDLVGKQRSLDGLASLAAWLDAKGSEREAGKVRDLVDDLKQVREAAVNGTTAEVLAVLRSQIGEGGLDASATALDQWSHGAISAHGDDLDALGELADLESDASRFPAWLSEQLQRAEQRRRGHPGLDSCCEGPGVGARRCASRHLGAHAAPAGR